MCKACDYTIHGRQHHFGWDNSIAPAERVVPGSTIRFHCHDSSAGQLGPSSTVADVRALDFGRINPVSGPIFVEGAAPGDALKITIDSFAPQAQDGAGFGWTANIPGFGLLADQFTEPALHVWKYDPSSLAPALWGKDGKVPLKPFAGTIGNAPAEPGHHSVVPPRRVGGNLDIRDLAAGTVLYLPVEVAGALFSVGDSHAAQGDGEVCGTAIESPMDVVLTLDLVRAAGLKTPRFTTPGPVTRHLDAKGYEVTTGIGPDLMAAARDAVAGMIDLLSAQHGMAAVDAYMLVSTCGDLRISEIVDMPNWVVSFYFPRCVFE
jgi:acetamidase/formamidase